MPPFWTAKTVVGHGGADETEVACRGWHKPSDADME